MLQRALIFLLLLHGVNARNDPIPTLHRVYRKDDPRLICDSSACSKLGTITCFGVPSSLSPLHYNAFWWRCRLNDVRSHIVEIRMEDDLDTLHVHLTPRREQNTIMDAIHLTWVLAMTYPVCVELLVVHPDLPSVPSVPQQRLMVLRFDSGGSSECWRW